MTAADRSHTFTWQDPLATAGHGLKLSGLAFLQALVSGRIPKPPIAEALGFTLAEVSEGLAVFTVEPAEFHYNPIGVVHGGLAATLLDSAMACSVQTTLPTGKLYTTLELKVNLVRPITMKTGLLRAEGRLIHGGSRVATAEGRLVDLTGRLYAHGTTTCMIFDAPAS
jgi:uncharacterized protein (TIGR00369 family)